MKTCSKCKKNKPLEEFPKNKSRKDGIHNHCKDCHSNSRRIYYAKNTEKVLNKQKNKYWNYPEEKRLYAKKHYEKNKEKYKPTKRKYWIKNRKRDLVKNKLWRIENIEHLKSYKKEQAALINANTAKRRAMKLCATPGWTNLDLVKEFYLIAKEKTFQEGIDYEVDHMIPLQGENVCGFHCQNNLQVITAVENYSKGNKLLGKYTKLSPIL